MNQLTQMVGAPSTMTSREIAELVDKRHDNVKRTVETLAARGAIAQPQIEDGPKSANGVTALPASPAQTRFGSHRPLGQILVTVQLLTRPRASR